MNPVFADAFYYIAIQASRFSGGATGFLVVTESKEDDG